MAAKPTLVQLTTGNVDPTVLNSNLDILAEAVADCWDKAGTGSGNNTVIGDLDMNGFSIKNLGDPDEDADSIATRGWVETNYGAGATAEAEHWANYPENQLVPEGDLVNDYSALHWAAKAAASVTAAQLAETNAETAETNAEAAQAAAEAAQAAAEAAAVGASGFDVIFEVARPSGGATISNWTRSGTNLTITYTAGSTQIVGRNVAVGDYVVIRTNANAAVSGMHVITAINPTTIVVTMADSGTTSGTLYIDFWLGAVSGIASIVAAGSATVFTVTYTTPFATNRYVSFSSSLNVLSRTTTTAQITFSSTIYSGSVGLKHL